MPGIDSRAALSVGLRSAMASSVASEKTTNAGTEACVDRALRHVRSASTRSGSALDGQFAQRPILTWAGVSNRPPQFRQRPGAPPFGLGVAESGAMPVRKRLRRLVRRPLSVRDSAQDRASLVRALVTPT